MATNHPSGRATTKSVFGADDLDQAVAYGKIQQARHSLGAHAWGICIGLDLGEKPRPSRDQVDVL